MVYLRGMTSILLRLRKVLHQDAYVSVPVTDEILRPNADGTRSIDFEAFKAAALRGGADAQVVWELEEAGIDVHPVQQPLPDGRSSYLIPNVSNRDDL